MDGRPVRLTKEYSWYLVGMTVRLGWSLKVADLGEFRIHEWGVLSARNLVCPRRRRRCSLQSSDVHCSCEAGGCFEGSAGGATPATKKDNQQSFARLHKQSFSELHILKKDYRESFSGLLHPLSFTWCTHKPIVYLHYHASRHLQATSKIFCATNKLFFFHSKYSTGDLRTCITCKEITSDGNIIDPGDTELVSCSDNPGEMICPEGISTCMTGVVNIAYMLGSGECHCAPHCARVVIYQRKTPPAECEVSNEACDG